MEMRETSSAGSTETIFVRAAIVQLDYQPSVVLSYPVIEEPALLAEGEQGIASLHLSVPGVEKQITTLRGQVATGYEDFANSRAREILEYMNKKSVDVVVFPEYSIPATCLPVIEKFAGGCTVIAGSHTVTPSTIGICQQLNIKIESADIGKSICPIRSNDRKWLRIDKLTRSRFEGTLKPGTDWQRIQMQNRKGIACSFAVFLCVDFINGNESNFQRLVPRDIWKTIDFAVVPSYSPAFRDFEQQARSLAERAGRPVMYANVASAGGSRIYCNFRENGAFFERYGTKALEPGDEAVVIVDLPLGEYAQFDHRPTPLPVTPSSELVALAPILSRENFPSYCGLHDRVLGASKDEQKRSLLQAGHSELIGLVTPQSEAPSVLKTKVYALLEAMNWRDGQWLDVCVECVPIHNEVGSLAELRFKLLYSAQDLLAGILRDPRVKGNELDAISGVLDVYRRALDYIRPRIRRQVVQKFDATDQAVHTLDTEPTSPTFTSVFIMRLRSARVHREALEKQIRLLATLAHSGNKHLTLNLRYRSLPNVGGNLKDLEIQIFGAARAADRSDSRRLADNFRRDLANLMRVTLRDAYTFLLEELEQAEITRATEPFQMSHVVELRRKVEFGIQPYINQASAPKIYHLLGNSSIARILDSLQSNPFACMVSIHIHPIVLTEAENSFFKTYTRASGQRKDENEGAMFFLGAERNPSLRMADAITMQRMLGDSEGLHPTLLARLFVASHEPISKLLLNTIGNELWGDESYEIFEFSSTGDLEVVVDALRHAWVGDLPPFVEAPEKLDRVPFLFDTYEASRMFRLPLDGHSGAVGTLFAVLPSPAAALPQDGIEIGLGFHAGAQQPIVVRLSDEDRTKHTYIVGKTGTGKSTLLSRMIEQDIRRGSGVCVIDPHGDLVDSVLTKVPDYRASDVVLLDPASTERPFGLNLLEYNPHLPHHKDFVVQETIAIMRKMFFHEHIGPVFEHSLRHLILTILDESLRGEGTLIEVPRLLFDKKFRDAVVPRLKDDLASDYWKEYASLVDYTKSESLTYVISKFDTFIVDHIMRNIIGQSRSTINIADIMEKRGILLVKLPSAVIGELNATLLGMILISKLRWASMGRAALPPAQRKDYYLYVDEFQNFAASGFESILSEARKYRLSLIVSHQHIGQLSAFNVATGRIEDRVLSAIFGNVGTMIAFRLGVTDAKFLAAEMGSPADPEDFENLKSYHGLVKMLIDGEVYPPFTIRTVLSSTDTPEIGERIKQESLQKHGRPRHEVEIEIKERAGRIIQGEKAETGNDVIPT